ncbi:MAG: TolB family protein [Planctomycetota bacterium]
MARLTSIFAFVLVFGCFQSLAIGQTTIVSVSSSGEQGNNLSASPSVSGDGRFVAFDSNASNLVSNDTNGYQDVFVHDRQTGLTEIVSVSSLSVLGDSHSNDPSISADGRFVAFWSHASNLNSGDMNTNPDVFVHDRQTGLTEIVSRSSSGTQGNSESYDPSISADGRIVAFMSYASNLVVGDTNGTFDVFVHDRQTGLTEIVSISSSGTLGNNYSYEPSISADGRFVAYRSNASNLISGDTNGFPDVFVHDRQTGLTEIVSISSSGVQGNYGSYQPSISADGRFVAFGSFASNLISGDMNANQDVFVHDRQTGLTEIVSISSSGTQGNSASYEPSFSADGRFIAYNSTASNLVENDTNGFPDVFLHDRQTSLTDRVSVSTSGGQGNGNSFSSGPSISANGQYVAFSSVASNLIYGDTNDVRDVFVRTVPRPPVLATPYGTGTPGCNGLHALSAVNTANIGNANFTLKCTNTPPNSLGGWFITDSQDIPGTDTFNVGVKLHVDFFNATEAFVIDSYSDATGLGTLTIPVPNNPVLVGKTFYAQAVWAWALTVCFNFPMGLSSSNGLSITIQ